MKQAFKFVLNLLSFGIPLLLRVLSRSRKFTALINHQVHVTLVGNVIQLQVKDSILQLDVDRKVEFSSIVETRLIEDNIETISSQKEEDSWQYLG